MERAFLLVLLVVCCATVSAQNITAVEYFIDTDPGCGNGTSVTITPAPEITSHTFSIDIAAQTEGFHTLFIRAQDANEFWSPAYSKPFYKLSTSTVSPVALNVVKVEYFFDSDPGFGSGTDVPITSAQSITNHSFTVPLSAVADGFHTLFVRTQDENGNWSPAYSKPFYKLGASTSETAPDITKLEYFIDQDPGFGAGIDVPITPGQALTEFSFAVSVNGLPEGEHTISVRAQNTDGQWSVLASQTFTICNHPGVAAQIATDITSSDAAVSWTESPGSSRYELELSIDNFKTIQNTLVIDPPVTSTIISGLSQGTTYQYRVRAIGACASVPSNSVEFSTLLTAPSNQPSSLGITSVTTSSYTVHFSPAPGSPTGYLVIRKVGSPPTFTPSNNVVYTAGQAVDDAQVAYVGADVSFDESGLSSGTQYFYVVFAYNQSGSQITYLQTSPLANYFSTLTLEPTGQPSNIAFSNIGYNGFDVSFAAATSADGYLVLRRASAAPANVPADGITYTEKVGTDDVAYQGTSTSFMESTLSENTTYYYAIYAYNGIGGSINYLTTSPLQGSQRTPLQPPVFSAATDVQQDRFTIHWTATTGATDYRLDVSDNEFVSLLPGFDDLPVTGTSYTVTGLEAGTAYQYRMRAVTPGGATLNSDATEQYTVPPTPALLSPADIGQESFTMKWSSAKGAVEYFIDVSEYSDFSSFLAEYDNKPAGDMTSYLIEGLTPGAAFYYRVRAANSGGTSPSSPSANVLLLPPTPLALDATNATSTSFKAKWEAVANVTEYRLDVTLAGNDFNPSLDGYTDKPVVGLTEELVTDLIPNTAYKYRIRAVNASGSSTSSLPVSVSTTEVGSGSPLTLTTPVYPLAFESPSQISMQVQGGTPPYTVAFYHRGITQENFTSNAISSSGSATYVVPVDESMLDDLGLEFYFEVFDANGFPKESGMHYIYRSLSSSGMTIPFNSFGGTAQSYEIFSIPYALEDNLIASIFDELGEYKKSRWRLVRYQNGRNVDFGAGINRIELGNSYWFNRKEAIDISFSNGTVAQVNQSTDAVIRLEPGWNQIGNPFPFDVDWDDVLAANPGVDLIGPLKVFNPQGFHLNDESNLLATWSGGFVHNGNSNSVELTLPVVLRRSVGGRLSTRRLPGAALDQPSWYVPIAISQGAVTHKTSGIGMHPNASPSVDRFDDFVVPRFVNYIEWYTEHEEFFTPRFSRDIVPPSESFTWNIKFESNNNSDPVVLSWNPQSFGTNEAELFLVDLSQNTVLNMRQTNRYQFKPNAKHSFKIIYAINREEINPDFTSLGNAYPNPFVSSATIPFIIAEYSSDVHIEIIDLLGNAVAELATGAVPKGVHEVTWTGTNHTDEIVPSGLYLYRMTVNGRTMTGRLMKK